MQASCLFAVLYIHLYLVKRAHLAMYEVYTGKAS